MERGNVTTPFGRRAMTLGMLASQITSGRIPPDRSIDKWKLFRSLCEAKTVIGVSDRSLAVLNALLSFQPGTELSRENGLVVFPSNAQLSLRTHGMAETTLRRHLACLVEAGLIVRRDSPNGKRYARKNRNGAVGEAFGFDLSPLLARAGEFQTAAAELAAAQQHLRLMRERLSLCRRDILKLIELIRETAPQGDWQRFETDFQVLAAPLPRKASADLVEALLDKLAAFRDELTNRLETLLNSQKSDGNERQNERHIQNSQPESQSESVSGLGKGSGNDAANGRTRLEKTDPAWHSRQQGRPASPNLEQFQQRCGTALRPPIHENGEMTPFGAPAACENASRIAPSDRQVPLLAVLQACPQIADYGPAGRIATWKDLMTAAIVVRTMLNISADAYQDACAVLGYENAATVIACILERVERINSPGAYLRDLTGRARQQSFSVAPMIAALSRARRAGVSMAN